MMRRPASRLSACRLSTVHRPSSSVDGRSSAEAQEARRLASNAGFFTRRRCERQPVSTGAYVWKALCRHTVRPCRAVRVQAVQVPLSSRPYAMRVPAVHRRTAARQR